MKIIDDMNRYFEDNEIDKNEERDLFFTLLKVEILSKPVTFKEFAKLIQNITDEDGKINEESKKNLVEFIRLAREDLDVQEKITDADKQLLADALRATESVGTKLNYSVEGLKVLAECEVSLNGKSYHIKRYKGNKVRIEINGEETKRGTVKEILRKIIKKYKLDILTEDDPDGKRTQTQKIGREVIEYFNNKSSQ